MNERPPEPKWTLDAHEVVFEALKPHFIRAGLSEEQFRKAWEAGRATVTSERLAEALHFIECDCPGDDRPGCHLRGWTAESKADRILARLHERTEPQDPTP